MSRNLTKKILFISPFIWKKIFLFQKNFVFKLGEKFCFDRCSTIPAIYSYFNVYIYSGKRWHTRKINKWMIGFKFGEFTWNRKLAIYKAKQIRKKKAKLSKKSRNLNV